MLPNKKIIIIYKAEMTQAALRIGHLPRAS